VSNPLIWVAPGVLVILAVSMGIAFIRVLRGPSLPDRVVALDLIGVSMVAIVATYSIHAHQPVLLRAATALALISFLATIAFAYYLQRKGNE